MTRKGIRVVLLIAIFASLGGVAYKAAENIWLVKVAEIKKNPLKLLDYVPEAALEVKDFRRTKVHGGRKVWEVAGEEARYLKAEKEAVIQKPRIIFYQKDGAAVEVTGNDAHLFFNDQEMEKAELQGGIEVNYQGFVFHTDEILYLKSRNHVLSPGKVSLKGEGVELEGVGMEIDLEQEKIRLLNKGRTKLEPERLKRVKSHGKKEGRA